jgi:CheY-like chemotaxis protein
MLKKLPCPTCRTPIRIVSAKWCDCVSKKLSIVCPRCEACFCKLFRFPMEEEWNKALHQLLETQTQEKFKRAVQASEILPTEKQTVLIVDDDEEIRLIAEYTVQEMGYKTLTASNAQEALGMVREMRPDIVLTDALMPKMDGRELCRRIKRQNAAIKVVVMSALYTSSRYRNEALKVFNADEYLAKPINFHKLHDILHRLSLKAA